MEKKQKDAAEAKQREMEREEKIAEQRFTAAMKTLEKQTTQMQIAVNKSPMPKLKKLLAGATESFRKFKATQQKT
eukprot:8937829-Karenia_brevis.AAC.1